MAFQNSVRAGKPFEFDGPAIEGLLGKVSSMFNGKYPDMREPLQVKYVKALLFGEAIVVDDTVMQLIRDSKFTNTIKALKPLNEAKITPEMSAICMRLMLDTNKMYGEASAEEMR